MKFIVAMFSALPMKNGLEFRISGVKRPRTTDPQPARVTVRGIHSKVILGRVYLPAATGRLLVLRIFARARLRADATPEIALNDEV